MRNTKLFLIGLGLIVSGLSVTARADIFDRIDQCERSGGGACVYNLLRELARNAGPGGVLIPLAGNYNQTATTVLCADQHMEPVVVNGTLTAIKMGWCGAVFNKQISCTGSVCQDGALIIQIIDPRSYSFTNEQSQSAIFQLK